MSYVATTFGDVPEGLLGWGCKMGEVDMSELTVRDVFEQAVRVGVDPIESLVRVFAGFEDAPSFLHGLFGVDVECLRDRAEVA